MKFNFNKPKKKFEVKIKSNAAQSKAESIVETKPSRRIPLYKLNDLVEVMFVGRRSNRLWIVDIIDKPDQEIIYVGVLMMNLEKWKVYKAENSVTADLLEKDFFESWVVKPNKGTQCFTSK